MAHTHQLPPVSGSNPVRQMSGNPRSSLSAHGSALRFSAAKALSLVFDEDASLKVTPWSGRMSSFEYNAASERGDHDDRLFTVSVSLRGWVGPLLHLHLALNDAQPALGTGALLLNGVDRT